MTSFRHISISDISLRQGADKLSLSFREKIEFCKLLDQLGTDVIELNYIRNEKIDPLLIKSILSATQHIILAVPVEMNQQSIDQTWNALKISDRCRLQVCAPVSSVQMEYIAHMKPQKMKDMIMSAVGMCLEKTKHVEFVALDATRSDIDFLSPLLQSVAGVGVETITLCDSAGTMLPNELETSFFHQISVIPEIGNVALGFSCSNQFGLSDACAVCAVQHNFSELKVSAVCENEINLQNITRILNVKCAPLGVESSIGTERLRKMSVQIDQLCHVSGVRTISQLTQDVSVKKDSEIMLNVHESKDAVNEACRKLGYDLSAEDLEKVWKRFSDLAEKREWVSLRELEAIIATEAMQVPPAYHHAQYVINTGSSISAMAHMKLLFHEREMEGISTGDGAIDAAFRSIEQATGRHFELDDFQIQSIAEGKEAMGETLVKLRHDGKLFSGRGISTDIVGASIMAYLNAMNKVIYEEEEV